MPLENYLADIGSASDAALKIGSVFNREAAFNALGRVYGPDAEAAVRGGLDQPFRQFAETQLQNAQTANLGSETAERNTLLPGKVAQQGATLAQTGAETSAQEVTTAGKLTENDKAQLGFIAQDANAKLKAGYDPLQVFDYHAKQLQDSLNLTSDQMTQMRAAWAKNPQQEADYFANLLNGGAPQAGIAKDSQGNLVSTSTNPATGEITPARNPNSLSPFLAPEGAAVPIQLADGTQALATRDKSGSFTIQHLPLGAKTVPTVINQTTQANENARNNERLTGQSGAGANGGAPAAAPLPQGTGNKAAVPADSVAGRMLPGTKQYGDMNDQAKSAVNISDGVAQVQPMLENVLHQIAPYTAGTGSLLKDMPGSVQNDLRRNLETLEANEFLTATGLTKNSRGQTGMGRVLASEVPMLKSAYGSMTQDQNAKQLYQHVLMLQNFLNRAKDRVAGGFQSAYGASPYDVAGAKPYTNTLPSAPMTRAITSGEHKGKTAVSADGGKTWTLQ